MLLNTQLIKVTDTELLTVLLGNRKMAETLLRNAKGSLFALLHQAPHEHGDLFCSKEKRIYSGDPLSKLQAAREPVRKYQRDEDFIFGRFRIKSPLYQRGSQAP